MLLIAICEYYFRRSLCSRIIHQINFETFNVIFHSEVLHPRSPPFPIQVKWLNFFRAASSFPARFSNDVYSEYKFSAFKICSNNNVGNILLLSFFRSHHEIFKFSMKMTSSGGGKKNGRKIDVVYSRLSRLWRERNSLAPMEKVYVMWVLWKFQDMKKFPLIPNSSSSAHFMSLTRWISSLKRMWERNSAGERLAENNLWILFYYFRLERWKVFGTSGGAKNITKTFFISLDCR